ncbi:hypothetical protein K443DRAFT_681637 [Laccaria amethystina LaAM-08-1]|uniref:Uncharacterized protein n=1 Tax=Laccaria amethystina LaAM-08-1 TaxID=1095629 RepID=A0A0C9XI55_9AGAR|nr:hypothetical protein K443DRAFT_681637 [Laccaria amethystina LaAM-08-1]
MHSTEKGTSALSTSREPPATQMEFLTLARLEAATSRSPIMLSQTFFTAKSAWNALTSRLIQ